VPNIKDKESPLDALNHYPFPAFMDEGERRFFIGYKTAVAPGRLNLVASQKARDGENIQEPG